MGKTQLHNHLVGKVIAGGRLELVSILGLGAYGVVYLARDLQHPLHAARLPWSTTPSAHGRGPSGDASVTGLYAVKCLHRAGLDARQQLFQEREIALHSLAGVHPSVVTLYQVLQDTTCIYVVMDYCPDGDLFSMVTESQRYTVQSRLDPSADKDHIMTRYVVEDDAYRLARAEMDRTIKHVFTQIVEAVAYCHQSGIYHRDLKPENILCIDGGAQVALADFGLATSDTESGDFGCGSTFYMGPECQGGIMGRPTSYNTAANDVWSLGVILVNLVCGRNPWKQASASDETFREYLRNPNFLREILPVSDSLNSILKRVFSPFPEKRCQLADLIVLIRNCDRLTATNAELKARNEARRLAQAQAHATASARAAREKAAAAEAKAAQARAQGPRYVHANTAPYATAAATPAPASAPAVPQAAQGTVNRRPSAKHVKARSLGHASKGQFPRLHTPAPAPAPHKGRVRHASLNNSPTYLGEPFAEEYKSPKKSASPASVLSPNASTMCDSPEAVSTPNTPWSVSPRSGPSRYTGNSVPFPDTPPQAGVYRRGSMAAWSRMVQQGKNAVPSLLDTLNILPRHRSLRAANRDAAAAAAAQASAVCSPSAASGPTVYGEQEHSDDVLVPPKLANSYAASSASELSTDEDECLSPGVFSPTYASPTDKQNFPRTPYINPPYSPDQRYSGVLVDQQGF